MKAFGILLAFLLIVAIGVVWFLRFGLSRGSGNGDGNGTDQVVVSDEKPVPSDSVEIRIEEKDIYFGDELCKNGEDLQQKIIETGAEVQYVLISDNAIKGTYDDVRAILSNLETALGITIVEN